MCQDEDEAGVGGDGEGHIVDLLDGLKACQTSIGGTAHILWPVMEWEENHVDGKEVSASVAGEAVEDNDSLQSLKKNLMTNSIPTWPIPRLCLTRIWTII